MNFFHCNVNIEANLLSNITFSNKKKCCYILHLKKIFTLGKDIKFMKILDRCLIFSFIHLALSIYLSVTHSVCQSVCLSLSLSLSIYIYIYIYI